MYSSSDKTGQDTRQQELVQKGKKYKGCVPVRYELAFLAFTGLTLQYSLKVHLSLAIVAMVKHQPGQNVSLKCTLIRVEGEWKTILEKHSTPNRNSNLNLPVISHLVYYKSSKLYHAATEVCKMKIEHTFQEGEFDWDEELQGHILGSYFYGYMCTQIIGGRLAEKFGAKFVYGPSILATSLLTMLSPMAARFHVYVFIVLRVLQGATSILKYRKPIIFLEYATASIFGPVNSPCVVYFMFLSPAIYLGSLLTMGLSGVLIEAGGWPLVSYAFGGAAAFWSLLWLLLVYDSPEKHPRISDEEKCYILTGLRVKEEGQTSPPVPWKSIFTSVPVWAAFTMHFGTTWVLNTFLSHIPTYSKHILHFDIKQNGFFSALPYLSNLITGVVCGILSQWLREKGYISHINAYKLFNGIASLGPAVALVLITVVGCNVTAIVILLGVTMGLRGAFFGGSYLNHMDLAINFSGTMSGILHTFINLSGILAPLVAGALTKGEQTLARWSLVFYISVGIITLPYLTYLILGSVEEQPWNQPHETQKEKKKVKVFQPKYTITTHM
uniref:Major facilitator superfamily (MFS) profile domain-containing protein n=1 Tax=Timema genevievae TaxID=629358 RepID=A0A7R9PHZ5_TIMGE|nr:unnamed protein product [Timema genevievae]